MPREITHWLIAEEAARRLENTSWAGALAANPNVLRLGAVFHDVLFFPHRPPGTGKNFRPVADRLHGLAGEDTFDMIRALYPATSGTGAAETLRSFLVGLVSHIFADSVFHPLIFHLSGDYYAPGRAARLQAVQGHHRLEGLIDIFFAGGVTKVRNFPLDRYLARAEMPVPELLTAASRAGLASAAEQRRLRKAFEAGFRTFAAIHGLCSNRLLGRWLHALGDLAPGAIKEGLALAYAPQLLPFLPRLAKPVAYLHPDNGEECIGSMAAFFEESVARTVALVQRLAKGHLPEEPGPPMQVGAPGRSGREAGFYAPVPFFRNR